MFSMIFICPGSNSFLDALSTIAKYALQTQFWHSNYIHVSIPRNKLWYCSDSTMPSTLMHNRYCRIMGDDTVYNVFKLTKYSKTCSN